MYLLNSFLLSQGKETHTFQTLKQEQHVYARTGFSRDDPTKRLGGQETTQEVGFSKMTVCILYFSL